nr:MAG TPA: hypothetical protein [Caudoviricetes sp.]
MPGSDLLFTVADQSIRNSFLCLVHITIRCNINNLSSIQRISKYISITTI